MNILLFKYLFLIAEWWSTFGSSSPNLQKFAIRARLQNSLGGSRAADPLVASTRPRRGVLGEYSDWNFLYINFNIIYIYITKYKDNCS